MPLALAADTAYGSGANLNWLVQEKRSSPSAARVTSAFETKHTDASVPAKCFVSKWELETDAIWPAAPRSARPVRPASVTVVLQAHRSSAPPGVSPGQGATESCKLRGHNERVGSGAAAAGFGEPAEAVDAPADKSAAGIFSVGFVSAAAGVFSNGTAATAAVVSLDGVPPSWGAGKLVLCAGGVSILPRMTGRPSLALPMITTFVFVDCAS